MLRMSMWLTVRTFAALFLVVCGIGMVFVPMNPAMVIGALLAATGLTYLIRLLIALRPTRS